MDGSATLAAVEAISGLPLVFLAVVGLVAAFVLPFVLLWWRERGTR